MFNFLKRKVEPPLNHWISFAEDFELSPTEFYAAVEKELAARKMPRMESTRIEFAEGGMLSEKRTYLRMVRERLVFDVCAAPFGTTYFFSCRTAEIPMVVRPWQVIACLAFLMLLTYLAIKAAGLVWAFLILTATAAGAIYTLRNLVALGLHDLDKTFMESPVFGSIYCAFFRKDTYYRIDSRLCYMQTVQTVVEKMAEEVTAAKGVKLIEQYRLSPKLGQLYSRGGDTGPQAPPPPRMSPNPQVSI